MNYSANIDNAEVAKFNAMAGQWWEPNGPCAPLHILNPSRLLYIQHHVKLAGKNILDVGCGAGILSEGMAALNANVTGIDASSDVIAAARLHATGKNLAIDYQACSIEEFIANNQQQFDVITCMELVEHVPDPAKLLTDCAQILKPGGQLFLSTINRTPKSYLLAIIGAEYILNILPKRTHDYKKFIRPSELASMLKLANLQIRDLKGIKFDPFSKSAELQDDVRVNYLATAIKEI